uniref:Secreted protein n=1 Tax=Pseudo-nitzschia australis TaxID=44445 RepID=A0A6V0CU19_9STRA
MQCLTIRNVAALLFVLEYMETHCSDDNRPRLVHTNFRSKNAQFVLNASFQFHSRPSFVCYPSGGPTGSLTTQRGCVQARLDHVRRLSFHFTSLPARNTTVVTRGTTIGFGVELSACVVLCCVVLCCDPCFFSAFPFTS